MNSPSGSKTHEFLCAHDDDWRENLEDYQKSTVEWYTYDKVPSQGWQEYKKTHSKNNATIDVLTRRCGNNK